MVANLALLINRPSKEILDRQLEALDQEFNGQLLFRCVGPLPPYSFATVDVQVPSFETVDKARRTLGLEDLVVANDIKQAYYQLATRLHPDRNRDDPEAPTRMAELAEAHQFLTAYAEAVRAWQGGDKHGNNGTSRALPNIPFDQQTVARVMMISIRRQEALI
jgi:hypothetical protein